MNSGQQPGHQQPGHQPHHQLSPPAPGAWLTKLTADCSILETIESGQCFQIDSSTASVGSVMYDFTCSRVTVNFDVYASDDCCGSVLVSESVDAEWGTCQAFSYIVTSLFTFANSTLADYDETEVTNDIESFHDGDFEITDVREGSLIITVDFIFDNLDGATEFEQDAPATITFASLANATVVASTPVTETVILGDASIAATSFVSIIAMVLLA